MKVLALRGYYGVETAFCICVVMILAAAITCQAEFRVNTYTDSEQTTPAIAGDAQGNFVVVWASKYQDGDWRGIYGQRFDSYGRQIGDEFRINVTTAGNQKNPDIAMNATGNFVVVWNGPDGSNEGIYGRRYAADGTPLAGEFPVNTHTHSRQLEPTLAMNDEGSFVVAWEDSNADDSHVAHWQICGQLYNSSGAPVGGEFIVSLEAHASAPDVAMDDSGDFVVIFQRRPGYYVYMCRYNANGTAKGSAVDVSGNLYANSYPSIGMAGGGDYVVAWTYDSESGSYSNPDIYAKRYDSSGSAIGSAFVVNTYTDGGQWRPSVAMNDDGDFTVLWNMGNIYGQRYKSDGTPAGDEFQINTYVVSEQRYTDVVMKDNSEFVAVWQSDGQDGSDEGIFAQFGPEIFCADFSGDLLVNFRDFAFLTEEWLQEGDLLETDLIDDDIIDELDLGALSEQWLTPCYKCSQVDIYNDGKIDFKDYAVLANNRLKPWPLVGDITGDGTADAADLKVLVFHWLNSCE